jgi:hypothetical protein
MHKMPKKFKLMLLSFKSSVMLNNSATLNCILKRAYKIKALPSLCVAWMLLQLGFPVTSR